MLNARGGTFRPDAPAGKEFLQAMAELGYRIDREVIYDFMEWRNPADAPALARELLRRKVSVIVAATPASIAGARGVTDSVPIVMAYAVGVDKPGGNLTGLAWDHGAETYVRQLDLLQEVLPKLRRVALLWDATDPAHPLYEKRFAQAVRQRGLELESVGVRAPAELEPGFARLRKARSEALVVLPSAQITVPNRREIMALARTARLPTLAGVMDFDWPGALLVSAPSQAHVPRRAAWFVAQILKGAKPAELPIEQPARYELLVDLKVARDLAVQVPRAVVGRASKVIE